MRIVQSAAAAPDLLAIWMEIGRHRPASADRVLDEIQDAYPQVPPDELAPPSRNSH